MKQFGITSGCTAPTYCPDDPVMRGQMAVFIMRSGFNLLLPANIPVVAWASPASSSTGKAAFVTIVGQNTTFSGATQVNAGSGITISNISVSNGTTLTAHFAVAPGRHSGAAFEYGNHRRRRSHLAKRVSRSIVILGLTAGINGRLAKAIPRPAV
jgi:ethanolamine utilization microcompartment shell protein EutL